MRNVFRAKRNSNKRVSLIFHRSIAYRTTMVIVNCCIINADDLSDVFFFFFPLPIRLNVTHKSRAHAIISMPAILWRRKIDLCLFQPDRFEDGKPRMESDRVHGYSQKRHTRFCDAYPDQWTWRHSADACRSHGGRMNRQTGYSIGVRIE